METIDTTFNTYISSSVRRDVFTQSAFKNCIIEIALGLNGVICENGFFIFV